MATNGTRRRRSRLRLRGVPGHARRLRVLRCESGLMRVRVGAVGVVRVPGGAPVMTWLAALVLAATFSSAVLFVLVVVALLWWDDRVP